MALDSEIRMLEKYKKQTRNQILKYVPPKQSNIGPPEKFDSLQFISSDDIIPQKRLEDEAKLDSMIEIKR